MELNRNTAVIIVICLIFFISIRVYIAMNVPSQNSSADSSAKFPMDLPAVFTGTLPCASCPGIETHLLLEDERFREVTWYIDREDSPFTKRGTWTFTENDSLILESEDRNFTKIFLLENDSFRLLDQSGNKIEGDLEDDYFLHFSDMEAQIRNRHAELALNGVEFLASGNEPFWSVRVTELDSALYQTPEMKLSGFLSHKIVEDTTTHISSTLNDGTELGLTIIEEYCKDSMSGFLFTHSVTVHMQGNEMTGCGRYL